MTNIIGGKEDVRRLVRQELGRFKVVPTAVVELLPFLIDPSLISLRWDYGESEEMRSCWIIAELPDELAIGFSESGFAFPYLWGLIDSSRASFGGDSSWYASLEDCFLQTRLWTGRLPDGCEVS